MIVSDYPLVIVTTDGVETSAHLIDLGERGLTLDTDTGSGHWHVPWDALEGAVYLVNTDALVDPYEEAGKATIARYLSQVTR